VSDEQEVPVDVAAIAAGTEQDDSAAAAAESAGAVPADSPASGGAADIADAAPAADEAPVDELAAANEESEEAAAIDGEREQSPIEGQAPAGEPPATAAGEEEIDTRHPSAELKAIIEALIFASPEPLSLKALGKLLEGESKEDIHTAIEGLKSDYDRPGGLQLVEIAGGFQIVTRSDLHEWVRRLFHERTTQKLSVAALETLAVVAYRQPVTALEVQDIRGVNTSGVMNTLLERGLVKIVGRKQVVGRPFMYATTREFLIRFGLNDLTDLPKVEDMAEALGIENPLLVEHSPSEEELPLHEPEDEVFAESAGGSIDPDATGEEPSRTRED
jgi:segregation and condensation protein B